MLAAEQPDATALRVLTWRSDQQLSYAELAARSDQEANWLRGLGAQRGDRLLLMLGNIVPLWEVILAAMKLASVMIPASAVPPIPAMQGPSNTACPGYPLGVRGHATVRELADQA